MFRSIGILAISLTLICRPSSAASPRFEFEAQVDSGGLGAFLSIPVPNVVRLFPDSVLQCTIAGDLRGAAIEGLSGEKLASEIAPCLVAGDASAALEQGSELTCLAPDGLAWSITYVADPDISVRATFTATQQGIAAGEYTLVFIVNSERLAELFKRRALTSLRSNPIRVVVGPAGSENEALSQLLEAGRVAAREEDWETAASKASDVIAIYPQSALAYCLLGEARAELCSTAGAIQAYTAALELLEANANTRTPLLLNQDFREARAAWVSTWLDELSEASP